MKKTEISFLLLQKILPKKIISKLFGLIASCSTSWISSITKALFFSQYKINLTEAESDRLEDYPNLNAFFIRRLKPSARAQPSDQSVWTSPADGRLTQFGEISEGTIIQAKGLNYTVANLFDNDKTTADKFKTGSFGCVYLAPHNYHRVHMPSDGTLCAAHYVPGDLFSVNETTTKYVNGLFCRNERVILLFEKRNGYFAIIMVGACLVGGIAITLPKTSGEVFTQIPGKDWSPRNTFKTAPHHIQRGVQIGYFYFGSTVIFLTSKELTDWVRGLTKDTEVLVGTPLAQSFGSHKPTAVD